MANTRNFYIRDIFASGAQTTIPASPVSGTSYRNTAITDATYENGWAFDRLVDSGHFNQIMHQYSSLLREVDRYGIAGWMNQVDYPVGAIVRGSDGNHYRANTENGPGSTVRDPATQAGRVAWTDLAFGAFPADFRSHMEVFDVPPNTPASQTDDAQHTGTWTVPPGIRSVVVRAIGGGGGGVGGAIGAAGGGGSYVEGVYQTTPGATVNYGVGLGGVGRPLPGTPPVPEGGAHGGSTTFGTFITAGGGRGGRASTNTMGGVPAGGMVRLPGEGTQFSSGPASSARGGAAGGLGAIGARGAGIGLVYPGAGGFTTGNLAAGTGVGGDGTNGVLILYY